MHSVENIEQTHKRLLSGAGYSIGYTVTTANKAPGHPYRSHVAQLSKHEPNQSSVKFSIFSAIEGGRCFLSREEFRQQELQPFKQEMEVITGGGQHGVNGIAGMVCKIIAAP